MLWNYDDQTSFGPANWPQLYPTKGQRQSPINIILDDQKLTSLTCCQGYLLNKQQTELSDHLNSRLRVASPPSKQHLDSIGERLRTSPDSGRPSGNSLQDSNSDRSAASSPSTPHDRVHRARKLVAHQTDGYLNKIVLHDNFTNDLSQQETRFCTSKRKLFLGYPRYLGNIQLDNNGHAWQANIPTQIGKHTRKCSPLNLLIFSSDSFSRIISIDED